MATAEQLARKRDRLRRGQVKDRKDVERWRDLIDAAQKEIARRGRRIDNVTRRIGRKERAGVETSAKGIDFIVEEEGMVLHTYNDPVGHCTGCAGHLEHLGPCQGRREFTREQCEAKLRADLREVEKAVRECVLPALAPHQDDALISLGFNIGTGGLRGSTLVRRINQGAEREAIREAFLMWRFAGGKPILLERRKREADLYLNGNYD